MPPASEHPQVEASPSSQQALGTLTPHALLGVAGGAAGIASLMHGAGGAGKRGPRKKEGAGVTPTPTLTLTLTLMLTLTLTSCGVQSSEFIRAYARQTDQDSPTSNSWGALVFLLRTLVCSKPTKKIFAASSASGTWATLAGPALSSRIANEARSRCPSGWQCRRHPGAIAVLRCTALRFSARRGASLPH